MQFTVDYGVPAGHKVTAAASWNLAATDIISDIMSWTETYVDTNGVPPGRALTSTTVIGQMLRNTAIKDMAGGLATVDDVNNILTSNGLPPIERYDVQVTNSAGTKGRVIPADRFIMLPDPNDDRVGETQFGTTVEAMELVNEGLLPEGDAPGVVATNWKSTDPVQIWTKGAAIALPILYNPNLLFTADVNP